METTARPPRSDPVSWLLRSRKTGRITVAQVPNMPLLVFFAATAARFLLHPRGQAGMVVGLVATLGLVVWALLEVFKGVNPFRRILGGVVLVAQVATLLPR